MIANKCQQCGDDVPDNTGLCVRCFFCDSYDLDENDIEPCPECGGTGEVPDNGTNMGECEECCGTGEVDY